MKVNEMRQKSISDLKVEHLSLLRELFNLRMQKATGQLAKNHEMRRVRRAVAKLLTIIREKMGTEV